MPEYGSCPRVTCTSAKALTFKRTRELVTRQKSQIPEAESRREYHGWRAHPNVRRLWAQVLIIEHIPRVTCGPRGPTARDEA